MAETENKVTCDNCGSKYTIIYYPEDVNYDPENCPFCGETINLDEDSDFDSDEYESLIDLDEE